MSSLARPQHIHIPCSTPSPSSSMCSSPPPSPSPSSSSSTSCKFVQFSRFVKISFTYPGDEYDRSALEPVRLTSSESTELREMRSHWRQQMEERIKMHANSIPTNNDSNSDSDSDNSSDNDSDDCNHDSCDSCYSSSSSLSPSPSSSPSASSQQVKTGRDHRSRYASALPGLVQTHALLQPGSLTSSHASPPCSPVMSYQDSCSSSSSEDECDPASPSQNPLASLTPQQRQQYQRLKRFGGGGSRNGMNAMMHRHSHFDQSKENVQCIA